MNYWQFKFNMKEGVWDEFETLEIGDIFSQQIPTNKKKVLSNCIGDIVFYFRTDSNRGIYFITEIISEPYYDEEWGYAVDMRVIKKLNPIYNDTTNSLYIKVQKKISQMGQAGSKYKFEKSDKPEELYKILMQNDKKEKYNLLTLNKDDLKNAIKIRQHYINEGYLFNTFNIQNIIKGEVKHLAFLGNLLNPKATHFKNDLFLNTFLDVLSEKIDIQDNFSKKNPKVELEKIVKDENDTYIGRIDLWIENDDYIIAIEGKIESKDSKGQLEKYDKFLQNQNKPYILLYLTLKGEEPENINIDNLQHFALISFEEEILSFINDILNNYELGYLDNVLSDYKDALETYLFNYHLSFQYSFALIQEITKNKENFIKYKKIKEYYYQNNRNTDNLEIIKDIAQNFEYAKAYIEILFLDKLLKKINVEYDFFEDINFLPFALDSILKMRKYRIFEDKIYLNKYIGNLIESNIYLDSSELSSKNIVNLLDEKYVDNLINKIEQQL